MPVSIDNQIVRRNVKKNDSAVYQCEASNKHGTILASANILVMSKYPKLYRYLQLDKYPLQIISIPMWSSQDSDW